VQKRDAEASRHRRNVRVFHAGPAKALVMSYVGRLVVDGYAEWDLLERGDIQQTGETFLLARR
jgi:hypothetical protein